jgi:5-methyltetrahydrofolate--homocysteine methyltransferase
MAQKILEELKTAVVELNYEITGDLTKKAMDEGYSAVDILNDALLVALDKVGILFRDGDYYLPDVLMSVKAYHNAYSLLEPELKAGDHAARGVVMIGTVAGDIHDIGKNIFAALLAGHGYDVVDLGVDVPSTTFVEKAKEVNPDIIGFSALLTTTMPAMKDTIDLLLEEGVRDRFKIIVGGAPLNQKFADDIGADGYGEDAQAGVDLVKQLLP